MIGKKVRNPKKSSSKADRVGALTAYITNPELANGREKCIHFEAENFITDDLKSQTLEMIALSLEATKSKDPIDHYVLSWQEGEQPTIQQAREAVQMTLKHFGLEGHQVIWGMHADTDNVHIHIEVNRVHPENFKVVEINKGFQKNAIQQAAAIIEKVQGWKTHDKSRFKTDELGHLITDSKNRPQVFENTDKKKEPTGQVKDKEIQTGEKSAQRLGIEQAAPIIAGAASWKDLHAQMAAVGMEYRREGSGAKVYVGDIGVKASDIDRKASFGNLQKRFGPYQPPQEIKPNEYNHHTKEPHPTTFGKEAGNGMRNLSKCNLAVLTNQGQIRRSGVLHVDARPGGRPVDGLRRGAGRATGDTRNAGGAAERVRATATDGREKTSHDARVFHQPLKANQSGWHEYIAIRDAQKAAKTHDTIELQKRHGDERAALAAKQKEYRDAALKEVPKGNGAKLNIVRSALAVEQAPEKLELQELQREERKALQAKYKLLPMYKQWKEQPLIVSEHVRPLIDQHISRDQQPPRLSQIIRSLTNSVDARHHITYQLNNKDVFRDEGRTIQVLDLKSDQGIAAALATAQQKFGNVLTLTGSTEFQHNAVAVAVANNLTCKFADPALDALRARLQADKYQVERATARAAAERLQATEKAAADIKAEASEVAPPNKTREAVPSVPAPEAQQAEPDRGPSL